jgi:DNA processing protein
MSPITESQIAGFIAWRVSPLLDVVAYQRVLECIGDPANLFSNFVPEKGLEVLAQKLALRAYREEARQTLVNWREAGIQVIVLGEERYPSELRHISDPPLLLSYRGEWLSTMRQFPHLSIVGSRRADSEGIEIAQHFAKELTRCGSCIVSGLALGIDGAAHRGSLQGRLSGHVPTIAVLGNGLSQVYPRSHAALAREILDCGGVLLSQFDPAEPPYPVNFLNRNRLIAALSLGTLVVQASDKSGSLVTAKHALEYGKELYIVPGSIKDPRYLGSNKLLQHGAHLVTSPDDLLQLAPELRSKATEARSASTDSAHHWLLTLLAQHASLHLDELLPHAPEPEQFFEQLLMLELEGRIARQPGNRIALSTSMRLEISRIGV